MAKLLLLVARILYGAIFLLSGIGHLTQTQAMVGYANSKGAPSPEITVPFSGGMMLTGVLGIVTGLFPRWGAAMLATHVAVTNYYMHAFWKEQDPQAKQTEMTNFAKNTSLIGGALLIALLDKAVVNGAKAEKD